MFNENHARVDFILFLLLQVSSRRLIYSKTKIVQRNEMILRVTEAQHRVLNKYIMIPFRNCEKAIGLALLIF